MHIPIRIPFKPPIRNMDGLLSSLATMAQTWLSHQERAALFTRGPEAPATRKTKKTWNASTKDATVSPSLRTRSQLVMRKETMPKLHVHGQAADAQKAINTEDTTS